MRSRNLISWVRNTVLNYRSAPLFRGSKGGRTATAIEWEEMQRRLQLMADLKNTTSVMQGRRR